MATIKISPDHVRSVASQFRQKSSESGNMVSQLKSAVSGMESEWEGMAKQRFFNDYTSWTQQMQKYVEMLDGIATELDRNRKYDRADGPTTGRQVMTDPGGRMNLHPPGKRTKSGSDRDGGL